MSNNPWFARIREGLFRDPSGKHRRGMGEAVWIYGYFQICADLETGQLVRKYRTIANDTGIPESTVKKMVLKLKRNGYIKTTRLGQGLVVQITKWEPVKKKKGGPKSSLSENGEMDQIRTADGPNPARGTTDGLSPSGQKDKRNSARGTTDGPTNETLNETQIYIGVFEFWNAQKIIIHREPERFKSCINAKLKHYTAEELCQGIKNYADILNSPDHFFSYRWTLSDFLGRKNGIDRFMDQEAAFKNFRKNGSPESPTEPPQETEAEKEDRRKRMNADYENMTRRLETSC